MEDGFVVFTAIYLSRRGYCCESGCGIAPMGLCLMQRNTAIHDGDQRVPPAKAAHISTNAMYPGLTPWAKFSFALPGSIHERRTSSICVVSASDC